MFIVTEYAALSDAFTRNVMDGIIHAQMDGWTSFDAKKILYLFLKTNGYNKIL